MVQLVPLLCTYISINSYVSFCTVLHTESDQFATFSFIVREILSPIKEKHSTFSDTHKCKQIIFYFKRFNQMCIAQTIKYFNCISNYL